MEARADLEVLRARREAELLVTARRKEEVVAAQAAHEELVRAQAQLRLENLKAHGRSLAADVPPNWRALVVRDLETFVTVAQFPATITDWEARDFIETRVQGLLRPFRAEMARQQEVERRRECAGRLINAGTRHARTETLFWSTEETNAACQEVERILEQNVTWKWTESEVIELVEEILDEWDEPEEWEDDEDDDSED